ncbi:MAG: WG repeat-containing protein [Acidobacteria bacterium]|nr:WG repeat-containing protein [Acidobacteriota bacterium]
MRRIKAALRMCVVGSLVLLCFAQGRAQGSVGSVEGEPLFLIWDEQGKYGFMDATGRVRIKPQYDGALPFTEGLAAVSSKGLWGFIDTTGRTVVPLTYRGVSPFSDGVADVTVTAASAPYPCGYIDHSGRYVIKPQNKFTCTDFKEGFAVVGVYDEQIGESLDGYINKSGELAIGGGYSRADNFSEGLARVNDFNETYFINREGETAINLKGYAGTDTLSDEYEPSGSFSEGLAEVGITVFSSYGYSRFGFVDKRGKVVFKLPERMRAEGAFHDGRALVLLTKTEKVKVDLGDEVISQEVEVALYGYINSTGALSIPARFSEGEDFSDGVAVVRSGQPRPAFPRDLDGSAAADAFADRSGDWLCINRAGAVVIKKCGEPLSSDELTDKFPMFGEGFGKGFVGGLFFHKTRVGNKDLYAYMDKSGQQLWLQPHGPNVRPPRWWRENF